MCSNDQLGRRKPIRVAVLTSGRADYSILTPVLRALQAHHHFDLLVAAFGMHLMPEHGNSIEAIYADGFSVRRVEAPLPGDSAREVAENLGRTVAAFATFYESEPLDMLIALGDRYEMFAAVAASVPFNLPVAHFHGGEETGGAIDEVFRHAITSMSDLHFTTHPAYAERVRAIVGPKRADRVHVVGAPGLDALTGEDLLDQAAFLQRFGVDMSRPTALVTYHPETRRGEAGLSDVRELIAALDALEEQVLLTLPNADAYGESTRKMLTGALDRRGNAAWFDLLGRQGYYSAMKHCAYLLGNSSSGIIEAASLGKPVVDIGERQAGRLHGGNVLHCPAERGAILAAVKRAKAMGPLSCDNVYGDGRAAERAIAVLERWLAQETVL